LLVLLCIPSISITSLPPIQPTILQWVVATIKEKWPWHSIKNIVDDECTI
jgi:hypothetical protein